MCARPFFASPRCLALPNLGRDPAARSFPPLVVVDRPAVHLQQFVPVFRHVRRALAFRQGRFYPRRRDKLGDMNRRGFFHTFFASAAVAPAAVAAIGNDKTVLRGSVHDVRVSKEFRLPPKPLLFRMPAKQLAIEGLCLAGVLAPGEEPTRTELVEVCLLLRELVCLAEGSLGGISMSFPTWEDLDAMTIDQYRAWCYSGKPIAESAPHFYSREMLPEAWIRAQPGVLRYVRFQLAAEIVSVCDRPFGHAVNLRHMAEFARVDLWNARHGAL